MEDDFKVIVKKNFSKWVESLSFREIQTNEPLIRAIENFERLLLSSIK
jgi:hypothetical protein